MLPEKIRQFLQQQPYTLTVALDPKGDVGEMYSAVAIPLTVVIDRGGKVAAAYMGFDPQIDQMLSDDLDRLLAGRPAPDR
jgi:hypothetical protein